MIVGISYRVLLTALLSLGFIYGYSQTNEKRQMLQVNASQEKGTCFDGLLRFAEAYKVKTCDGLGGSGFMPLDMECIRRTDNREYPYPIAGHPLITNPPVFTWPNVDYKAPVVFPPRGDDRTLEDYARYDIQLGRSRNFTDKDAIQKKGLCLSFYNHHQALQPGIWYWRYRVSGKEWSETFSIEIPESTPLFETPEAESALRMIPVIHPVIYRQPLMAKRPTADQQALLKLLRSKAEKAFSKKIASYKVKGKPIPAGTTSVERAQIMRFHLRYEVEAICRSVQELITVYQIDRNEAYLTKALELSDHIAAKDPQATYSVSDFTGARCMSALAMVYDVAFDRLNSKQKGLYESFMSETGARVMDHVMQENIGSADGILCAHFFQHTFYDAFTTAIVMRGHLPQADTWFRMLYDIWLSRSPGGGFLSDGVWPNGNMGYIHVNMESMVSNFLLFRDLFGVNLFHHPWYANCANALAYTVPIGSAGDGFSDGCEHVYVDNMLRPDFAYVLGRELGNPFAVEYAYRYSGQQKGKTYHFHKANFSSYRLQSEKNGEDLTASDIAPMPQSAVFPQTGIAVMNTDVMNADTNLFVSFRSSPFGVGSHGLAEQNSFNLSYKGKPVFYPTGYRITTADKHHLLSQKHSRARNTITVDGKTQAFSHCGYGWIARYLDGKDITYVLGDASKAYVPFDQSAGDWINALTNAGVYTSEHGFILTPEDNPQVKLFRRHLILLRPNILVVYDELEADKDVTWTFQLNGLERSHMKLLPDECLLTADTDKCDAQVKVLGSAPLVASLADTSYVKPFDWLNPQRGRPAIVFEKQQFHSKFENRDKCKKMRFLAIIQIDGTNTMHFVRVAPDTEGTITLGNYRINGQLDADKEACLEIENIFTGEYLLYGPDSRWDKKNVRKFSHSTLLFQKGKGWQESIDRYPLMAVDKSLLQKQSLFLQKQK